MSAQDDREFLEGLAVQAETEFMDGDVLARRLRAIAAKLANPEVQVVEQQSFVRKSPTAPDGWSWSDIGPFTGYYSGIRLQKGEPWIEQDGHTLFIRQAEVSFSQRQQPIYAQASRLCLPYLTMAVDDGPGGAQKAETTFRNAASVLVVHGFQGAREAMTWFREGRQLPTRVIGGAEEITASITKWLQESHAHPIVPRQQPPRGPKQERLT